MVKGRLIRINQLKKVQAQNQKKRLSQLVKKRKLVKRPSRQVRKVERRIILDSQKKREVSDEGGQSTPKDKIYAKGHGSVSYNSSDGQIKAQVPSYEGYTEETVKEALGEPEAVIRDPKYLTGNFRNQEIKNLKSLYLDQHLTKEQLSAFGAAVADVAVGVGLAGGDESANSYVLYSYKKNEVFLVFYKGQLLYITPDPAYLSFD